MAPWQLCTFLLRPWRRDNCSCSHGRMSCDLLEHEIMRSLWKAVTRPFSTCLPISLGSQHETFSQLSSLMSCEAVWLAFLEHSCRFWNYLSTTWHQLLSKGLPTFTLYCCVICPLLFQCKRILRDKRHQQVPLLFLSFAIYVIVLILKGFFLSLLAEFFKLALIKKQQKKMMIKLVTAAVVSNNCTLSLIQKSHVFYQHPWQTHLLAYK